MMYKKKIKGKTGPAENVKKLIDWANFMKEGGKYIAEHGVPETETDYTATAAIMMTGGTTGNPKGVMLSSENINNLSYELVDVVEDTLGMAIDKDNDGMLTALPVFHGFGFALCMHVSMCVGMAQSLFPAFDAKCAHRQSRNITLIIFSACPISLKKYLKQDILRVSI